MYLGNIKCLIPGTFFVPGGGSSSFMRASFSVCEMDQFDTAFESDENLFIDFIVCFLPIAI